MNHTYYYTAFFFLLLGGCSSDDLLPPDTVPCVESPAPVEWTQVTAVAPWNARDSAGEMVFDNRMWIMGGWFDSFKPTPRDVWSSTDGRDWQLVTPQADWTAGDLASIVSFKGRIWLLGGWSGGRLPGAMASNEVWGSGDGKNWSLVTVAPWSARLGAAAVEFRGRLWLLGGVESYYFGDHRSLKNDIWASPDGEHWTQVVANAPWTPRAFHAAFVFDDRLWVIGGGNYTPYMGLNDVWSSHDGVHWTQISAAAPWHPRIWFSSAVYRGVMWIIGGWSDDPYKNWGDVWYSKDGSRWTQLENTKVWSGRHEHSTYVFDDHLWVTGGFNNSGISNDVWSLWLPPDWVPGCGTIGNNGISVH